jgi:hypothetical protein
VLFNGGNTVPCMGFGLVFVVDKNTMPYMGFSPMFGVKTQYSEWDVSSPEFRKG